MKKKKIKARIEIFCDRWQHMYAFINGKRYLFKGTRGIFAIEKTLPKGKRVERIILLGS